MLLAEFMSASCLLPILQLSLFSDFLSVTNVFCCTFLSNHASQPLQTYYGALAMGSYTSLIKFRSTTYLPQSYQSLLWDG